MGGEISVVELGMLLRNQAYQERSAWQNQYVQMLNGGFDPQLGIFQQNWTTGWTVGSWQSISNQNPSVWGGGIIWGTNPVTNPSPPTMAPSVLPKETVAGPIRAYRAWQISQGYLNAMSSGCEGRWPKYQPAKAVCIVHHEHQAPFAGCTCGYYAFRKVPLLIEEFGPRTLQGRVEIAIVMGEVALWGKVIAHELGYRAEYAWPVRVWLPPKAMPGFPVAPGVKEELEEIRKNYGCEVLEEPPEGMMEFYK